MSQENVELVRRHYEHRQSHGDFLDEIIASDYVWDMSHLSGWPEQRTYEGIDEARQFIRDWTAAFDDWAIEVEAIHDAGDERVVGVLRQRGRSKSTGVSVDMRYAQVFTIRDGKHVRMEMYDDPDEALKAVGLQESTMSHENVEIVRAFLDASLAGDNAALVAALDPAIEWTPVEDDPDYRVHCGLDDVTAWLAEWSTVFPDMRWKAERIVDDDDTVVALVRALGRGDATGAEVDTVAYGVAFTVRSGKIVKIDESQSETTLKALGLRE